jgi:hypothetical protein
MRALPALLLRFKVSVAHMQAKNICSQQQQQQHNIHAAAQ